MARTQGKRTKPPISLLLVEGDTDVLFYERIKAICLGGERCRVTIRNLEGLFNINRKVVDKILATQQIESWFFWDIEGIYTYLKVKRSGRRKTYRPPKKYTYHDMIKLFRAHGKTYNKGKRCEHFIKQLNIETIVENCGELKAGIELIKTQSGDTTNHLFG